MKGCWFGHATRYATPSPSRFREDHPRTQGKGHPRTQGKGARLRGIPATGELPNNPVTYEEELVYDLMWSRSWCGSPERSVSTYCSGSLFFSVVHISLKFDLHICLNQRI